MASIRQFSVFALVGLACAVLDITVMQALLLTGLHPVLAATFGFLSGLVANFLLHSRVTFKGTQGKTQIFRFLTVVAINYLITVGFVSLSFALVGEPLLGKILSLPLVAINGFFLSKHWVFK